MADAALESGAFRAIVFDLDGTLYRQQSLRRTMALRLLTAHIARPRLGFRTARVLAAYRQAQEHLRGCQSASSYFFDLAALQLELACAKSGATPEFVLKCVSRWMDEEPLPFLAARIQPGLVDFLRDARACGLKLAVLSDYPPEAKLRALGLEASFDLVLSAQAPSVGVFKPHPRGIQIAMQLLSVTPEECIYVGDRADVDGAAAEAAGVRAYILGPGQSIKDLHGLVLGAGMAQLLLDPA